MGNPSASSLLDVSPNAKYIASGLADSTIQIWDVQNPETAIEPLVGHSAAVRSLHWSRKGRLASSSFDGRILIWEEVHLADEKLRFDQSGNIAIGYPLETVRYAPDGRDLAASSVDGRVWIASSSTGRLQLLRAGHSGRVSSLSWASTGDLLITAADDNQLRIWDGETGLSSGLTLAHCSLASSAAWAEDGAWLAVLHDNGTLRHHAGSGTTLLNCPEPVTFFAVDPDTGIIAATATSGRVYLSIDSPDREWPALDPQEGVPVALSFGPASTLATAYRNGSVVLWDSRSRSARHKLKIPWGEITAIAVSNDARLLAVGTDDGRIEIRTADGELRNNFTTAGAPVCGVAWSEHQTLASCSTDGSIFLWNRESPRPESSYSVGERLSRQPVWLPGGRDVLFVVGRDAIGRLQRDSKTLTRTKLPMPNGSSIVSATFGPCTFHIGEIEGASLWLDESAKAVRIAR